MGGSLLVGALRNVKRPCPALRSGPLGSALGFRFPCLDPRPAAFNSLRSSSFSCRSRSFSSWVCSSWRRRSLTSTSRSLNCLRRSSRSEPSIAPYRGMESSKCPAPCRLPITQFLYRHGVHLIPEMLAGQLEGCEVHQIGQMGGLGPIGKSALAARGAGARDNGGDQGLGHG